MFCTCGHRSTYIPRQWNIFGGRKGTVRRRKIPDSLRKKRGMRHKSIRPTTGVRCCVPRGDGEGYLPAMCIHDRSWVVQRMARIFNTSTPAGSKRNLTFASRVAAYTALSFSNTRCMTCHAGYRAGMTIRRGPRMTWSLVLELHAERESERSHIHTPQKEASSGRTCKLRPIRTFWGTKGLTIHADFERKGTFWVPSPCVLHSLLENQGNTEIIVRERTG